MKLFSIVLIALFSLPTLASEVKTYECGGVGQIGTEAYQEYELIAQFKDYTKTDGYNYEKLIITKPVTKEIDLKTLRELVKLSPRCSSLEEFTLQSNGGFEYYKFEYKQKCGAYESHKHLEVYCDINK